MTRRRAKKAPETDISLSGDFSINGNGLCFFSKNGNAGHLRSFAMFSFLRLFPQNARYYCCAAVFFPTASKVSTISLEGARVSKLTATLTIRAKTKAGSSS